MRLAASALSIGLGFMLLGSIFASSPLLAKIRIPPGAWDAVPAAMLIVVCGVGVVCATAFSAYLIVIDPILAITRSSGMICSCIKRLCRRYPS